MSKTFITGIAHRADRLDWTLLKVSGSGLGKRSTSGAIVTKEEAAEELQKSQSKLKGDLHVALPADRVLLHIVELPTSDPQEMEGMVELQLEEVSPFPLEKLYSSFEVLEIEDPVSRVAILAAQQEDVDALGDFYHQAGLKIERIDVDLLAWWHLIKQGPKTKNKLTGRRFVLILDETHTFFIASDNGDPFLFRTLALTPEGDPYELMEELAEDVEYTQTTMGTGWDDERVSIDLWHWGGVPKGVKRLEEKTDLKVTLFKLQDLPELSEGVAQRGLIAEGSVVDLVPAEWKQAEETERAKKKLITTIVATAAIWLCCMIAFFVMFSARKSELAQLESKLGTIEGPASEVKSMRDKIQSLSQYTNRTYSVLEMLLDTSIKMSPGTKLISWRFQKGKSVEIRAQGTQEILLGFERKLQDSPLFAEIKSRGLKEDKRAKGGFESQVTGLLPEDMP